MANVFVLVHFGFVYTDEGCSHLRRDCGYASSRFIVEVGAEHRIFLSFRFQNHISRVLLKVIFLKSSHLLFFSSCRYESIQKRGTEREYVSYKPGDIIHGFRCVNVRPVPELNLTAFQFVHERTGADYVHLDCADTDNTFRCVVFSSL